MNDLRGLPGEGREHPRPVPIVPLVVGGSVLVVVFLTIAMIIALTGGADRDDADGLASDVTVAMTVLLSSRAPERAYDHLSAACRAAVPYADFEADVQRARADLAADLDIDLGLLAVAEVDTRDVAGREGEARVRLEEIGFDEIPVGDVFTATDWSGWTYEQGLWRATDCADPLAL